MRIGMHRRVLGSFDEVLTRLQAALGEEGFGVLTRIDLSRTLKEKLGVDHPRQEILGACNPKLAHQALSRSPGVGTLLPCNVTVWQEPDGVAVAAVDPLQTLAAADEALRPVAEEVRARLVRVLERLPLA